MAWEFRLQDYHDSNIVKFLRYGWPINYTADKFPESSSSNHPSALSYSEHVDYYIATELELGGIVGPFIHNPLPRSLICSPLQTVPKRGSTKRCVVMDLSFPPSCSVNSGIPDNTYLDEHYKLRLPGIDRLCEFILQHGRGCLLYKLDLQRAYRQLPIDTKDYFYLGFRHKNMFYFDTRCPFGLRTSAMICQRTTKAVVHCFTALGFFADVYLDDFYGATPQSGLQWLFRLYRIYSTSWDCRLHPTKTVHLLPTWFVLVWRLIRIILHFQSRKPVSRICSLNCLLGLLANFTL